MKIIRFIVMAILAITFGATELNAQCSVLATAQSQSLTLTGGSSYTKFSVAYNPSLSVYYTTNGNYVQTHSSSTGGRLSSYYHSNTRAIWWNSNTSQLESNGYGYNGTYKYTLNTSGSPVSVSSIHTGYNQPNYNSQGAYDKDANQILYFNSTAIYRYSRTTGKYVGARTISGLPVSTSYLTSYSIIYTGCSGKEVGLYDRVNRRMYFLNKSTGAYVGYSQLPSSAPTPSSYGVAYANGLLWLSNGYTWYSYKVLHSGLQTSAISGPFCDSSKVSINFSLNAKKFNSGNVFTAQLSNGNGSFASPVTLDTLTSTTAQTMTGYIPKNTTFGNGYRIRVVASNPSTIGVDNGTNITINVPNPNLGVNVSKCPGDTATLTAAAGGLSYNWSNGGTSRSIKLLAAGTYRVTVSNSVCSKSDTIVVSNLTAPSPTLTDTITKCASSISIKPGTFASYKWNTGATTSSISVKSTGLYVVTVTGSNSCKASDSSFVNLLIKEINGGKDTSICSGDTIELASGTGCNFKLTSMLKTGSKNVDNYYAAGDDRGGIAVTQNYLYYTGDNYTARYDVNLNSYTRYTRKDGIFSDLADGQLYTFWNTTYSNFYYNTTILASINSLRTMNSSLGYTGSVINLSQTINATNGAVVFAGSGYVILWAGYDQTFYKIDLPSGQVTNLGKYNLSSALYYSESWASWGIAECNGTGHNVVLRTRSNTSLGTSTGEFARFNISTKTFSKASSFGNTNLGDIACITYSPWNGRWYFQSEYSTVFGSNSENIGYATATHIGGGSGNSSINTFSWSTGSTKPTIQVSPTTTTNYWLKLSHGSVSCSDTIAVKVNATPAVKLLDTLKICNADSSLLSAKAGFSSYKWNTNKTSRSIYVKGVGMYLVTVTDAKGCKGSDSSFVNILDARIDQKDTTLCSADSLDLIVDHYCGNEIKSLTTNNLKQVSNAAGYYAHGIAVTKNYVYVNGSSYCVRYSSDLTSSTTYSRRYGIFSDLSDGQLYTFWNTTYNNFSTSTTYTQNINAIRKMDASLNYGTTITLSQNIDAGSGSLIAAGTGYVIIYSARNYKFYKITLKTGKVEVLGTKYISNYIYRYSDWASWGIAECGNDGHSLVFRSRLSGLPISRYNISKNSWSTVATRSYGYGYISSIAYSPWSKKWYAQHRYSITGLGSNYYNLISADASAIGYNYSGSLTNGGKFKWSTNDTIGRIKVSPSTTTNYSVTVSNNSNSCSDTVKITVIQSPTVTDSVVSLKCFGNTNGSASVSASGGTTPYTYKWSNGKNTSSISSLKAGFYAYSVTGKNSCQIVDSVEVKQPAKLTATSKIIESATCYTSNDGKASVVAAGGISPYSYLWPSGTKDTLDTLVTPGVNRVTITDSNSCVLIDTVTMTSPAKIAKPGPVTSTKTFFCPGDSGTLVAANPGSVNSKYSKTTAVNQTSTSGNLTYTFSGVPKKVNSGGTLKIYFKGDLDYYNEYLSIYNESNGYVGTTRYVYANCNNYNSVTINLSKAQLQAWASDGKISFQTRPSSTYYVNGCTYDYTAYMVLDYDYLGGKTYWFKSKSTDTTAAIGSGANLKIAPKSSTTYYAAKFTTTCSGEFDSIKVIVAPKPNITYTMTPSKFCAGDSASVAASGAVSYKWPTSTTMYGSGSSATVYPSSNTDYMVTVTDYFNCKHTDTMTIKVQPKPSANILSSTNVSCSNNKDGTAAVYGTGGTAPFVYSWSNGLSGPFQLKLGKGNYVVTVTDKNSCKDTVTVKIGGPTDLKYNETLVNIKCNGQGSGSISLSPSGGKSPYSYSWTGGATTSSISNLSSGNYSVTVTDNSSCTHDTTFTITEPKVLVASILSKSDETCPGVSNGAISVGAVGGTIPYTYKWSNGATASSLSSLKGGIYSVTVTDKNSCTSTVFDTVKTIPSNLSLNVDSKTNVLCFNDKTGSASVSGLNGKTPYSYKWSNGTSTSSISNVGSGLYIVTVTDGNSCQFVDSITLSQNPKLVSSATITKNVSCNGLTDGSASIQVSGGKALYSYSWPDGKTTATNSALGAATHIVSITDANSCKDSVSVTITEPKAINIGASLTNLTCNASANGSISITATGGNPSYGYSWTNGATTSSVSNLSAGNYTVTVTDGKGCSKDSTFTVSEPAKLSVNLDSVSKVKCKSSAQGAISTSTSGGTKPYSYLWSNGAKTSGIIGLVAAKYTVSVTDSNGCVDTVSAQISEPANPLVVAILDSTNNPCYGGVTAMAKVTVSGGGKPYTYAWSNGGSDSSITNQKAGSYSVLVTDNYGCQVSDTVTLREGDSLSLSVQSKKDVSCYGLSDGNATIAVVGGTPSYSYSWSNGANSNSISNVAAGTYKMVLTDANGCMDSLSLSVTEPGLFVSKISKSKNIACKNDSSGFAVVSTIGGTAPLTYNWNNGLTNDSIFNVKAGTYSVIVIDANGCKDTSSISLSEPSTSFIAFISDSSNVSCFGGNNGMAKSKVSGGGLPYSYSWSNGGTDSSITNQIAGKYSVLVTDSFGCSIADTITITQPLKLNLVVSSKMDISCNGLSDGNASVLVTGGTMNYTYNWTNNSSTTNAITNVTSGSYKMNVSDKNGCKDSITISLTQPISLKASISSSKNISCNGDSTGYIAINVRGGTTPYGYSWNTGASVDSLYNLKAGSYKVVATDKNGCLDSISATLTQPSKMVLSASSINNLCYGAAQGSAQVSVTGGVTPYKYNWTGGSSTDTIKNLLSGKYIVTVTDSLNCQDTISRVISEPSKLSTSITSKVSPLCKGAKNGSIAVKVTGGITSYSYKWSNGDSTSLADSLTSGTYLLTVTDGNSCTDTLSVLLSAPTALNVVLVTKDVLCNKDKNGNIITSVSGGTTPYKYAWSNSKTDTNLVNIGAGIYSLTVSDSNKCEAIAMDTVFEPNKLVASVTSFKDVYCAGDSTGQATINAIGGTSPYRYSWSGGQVGSNPNNLTVGLNVVTVLDTNGCKDTTSITLKQLSTLKLSLVNSRGVLCNGDTTGYINVSASGGKGKSSYTWSVAGIDSSLKNLGAGNYSAFVMDSVGCTDSLSVSITQPSAISITSTNIQNVLCFGDSNGSATMQSTGGTGNLSYIWSTGDTTSMLSNLKANTYQVTVTDSNKCSKSIQVQISEPGQLLNSGFVITNPNCYYDTTGSVTSSFTGGVKPFTYSWSNGDTLKGLNSLIAGFYVVSVTDSNGCTAIDTAKVLSANARTLSGLPRDTTTCGDSINLTSALSFTKYSWSTGGKAANVVLTKSDTVSFKGLDANGCYTYDTVNVIVLNGAVVNLGNDVSNICEGTVHSINAGAGFVSYKWSGGEVTPVISVTKSGTYMVTVSDSNNCVSTDDVVISMLPLPVVNIGNDTVICEKLWFGIMDLDAGSGFSSYSWSTGKKTGVISITSGGTYSVTVTDTNGCEGKDTIEVVIDKCNGVNTIASSLTAKVYPNPARSIVNIELKGIDEVLSSIELVTTNGQVIRSLDLGDNLQSDFNAHIDLVDLAPSVYYIRINAESRTIIKRLVIY